MQEQRKLTAIMFTDIVGYTQLMGQDEKNAMRIIGKHREILMPIIKEHSGTWLKEMGDGTLSSFQSTIDAVNCATAIQVKLRDITDFEIRIGIHLGDVVFSKGDIFGDGVNIASRIEPTAIPGGISISGQVYFTLSSNKEIKTKYLGEKNLKNVNRPIKIYSIITNDLPSASEFDHADDVKKPVMSAAKPVTVLSIVLIAVVTLFYAYAQFFPSNELELIENRIVITYFENETGDPNLDYLGRLIAENLAQGLEQLEFVEVLPFMTNKKSDESRGLDLSREIAEKVGAKYVVSGAYYQNNEALSIQPQIIDNSTGNFLRSFPSYNGKTDDPTEEITIMLGQIQSAFALKLDFDWGGDVSNYDKLPPYNAFEEFNEGMDFFTKLDMLTAIERFNVALEIYPDFYICDLWKTLAYYNMRQYATTESLLRDLSQKRSEMSKLERGFLLWLEASIAGNLPDQLHEVSKQTDLNDDWFYVAGIEAISNNKLYEAEKYFSKFDPDKKRWRGGWEGYWIMSGDLFHMLGKHEDELERALDQQNRFSNSANAVIRKLSAQIGLGQIDSVKQSISEVYLKDKLGFFALKLTTETPGYFIFLLAQELYVHNYKNEAFEFLNKSIQWFAGRPEDEFLANRLSLFDAMLVSLYEFNETDVKNDLEETVSFSGMILPEKDEKIDYLKRLLKDYMQEFPNSSEAKVRLAILSAKTGDLESANSIYEWFGEQDPQYIYGQNKVNQAKIAAAMGDEFQAVSLLRDAFGEGYRFSTDYHNNYQWYPLRDNPEFMEFMEPKN